VERLTLDSTLSAAEFRRWYWLKEALVAFCRQQRLPTAGAKTALAERIAAFLATGESPPTSAVSPRPRTAHAPAELTTATIIWPGCRCGRQGRAGCWPIAAAATIIWPGFHCGQQARAFFLAAIGPRSHFAQRRRDFIGDSPGKALQDAVDDWHAA